MKNTKIINTLKVNVQGVVIVERDELDCGYMILWPDGCCQWEKSKRAVNRVVKIWAADNATALSANVLFVEWR
jgi:hypothetical protein